MNHAIHQHTHDDCMYSYGSTVITLIMSSAIKYIIYFICTIWQQSVQLNSYIAWLYRMYHMMNWLSNDFIDNDSV